MKLGRSAAISPIRRELTPRASAPAALPRAMSSRRKLVPSWRWKAMTWPPASTTTQERGFMPASLPLAKVAVMMVLALSRLMRKSLIGGLSWNPETTLTEKARQEKPPSVAVSKFALPSISGSVRISKPKRHWESISCQCPSIPKFAKVRYPGHANFGNGTLLCYLSPHDPGCKQGAQDPNRRSGRRRGGGGARHPAGGALRARAL